MATKKVIREQAYLRTIKKFSENFDAYLKDFLTQINQQ